VYVALFSDGFTICKETGAEQQQSELFSVTRTNVVLDASTPFICVFGSATPSLVTATDAAVPEDILTVTSYKPRLLR
jgi:hypothetical protein